MKCEDKNNDKIVYGAALAFFVCVTSYKLLNASLWYDEAVEYYYSKALVGIRPGTSEIANMYQRIVSTFQPPLYNFIMFFWLKLNDSEWWFRFFGIVMGVFGAIGTYKCIAKNTESGMKGSVSIFLYALIYRQTYYWQEAAEYCLMLGLIPWCIYYFIEVITECRKKNILSLILFSVLAMYSQYGSVFIVVSLLIVGAIIVFRNRNESMSKFVVISYTFAGLFTGLPLYFFFLKKQMENQGSHFNGAKIFTCKEYYENTMNVIKYNFAGNISDSGEIGLEIMTILFSVWCIVYIFKGRNISIKYLIAVNIICYTLFYFAVHFGVYAHTGFGGEAQYESRYSIFLIPTGFILGMSLINEFIVALNNINFSSKFNSLPYMIKGIIIVILVCWGINGWDTIKDNWSKQDNRGMTEAWYEHEAYNSNTFVYKGTACGFTYYLEHDEKYQEDFKDKIVYQTWNTAVTKEEYLYHLDAIYGNVWPDEMYIVASHIIDKGIDTLMSAFSERGYKVTVEYSGDGSRLLYYTK